jgi:adenosylcobinamide-GDP ribazoletransferase
MLTDLGLALSFLTILPVPRRRTAEALELAAAMAWFPLVGLLLGGVLTGSALGLILVLPDPATAALVVALLAVATRALHLDGLADTLDGLGGGQTREASLRIMKDHAVGAFGAVGLVLALLLKYGLILGLLEAGGLRFLLIFPVISRAAMVLLAYLSPYARPEGGLGEAMTTLTTGRTLALAGGSAVLIVGLVSQTRGLAALAAAAVLTWSLARYFRHRLGGVTGDIFGAVNEVMEIITLLVSLGLSC